MNSCLRCYWFNAFLKHILKLQISKYRIIYSALLFFLVITLFTGIFATTVFATDGDYAIYVDTNGTHDTDNASYTGVPFNYQQTQESAFTQDANDIDVDLGDAGHYLFGYSVQARNDSYGNRISYLSRVTVGGTENLSGHGQGYRRSATTDRYYAYGYGIVNVSSNDDIRVEIIRQGANTASHVLEANHSSFWIVKLRESWAYLKLQGQNNQSTSTSKQDINFTTSVENTDTDTFGHSTSTNSNQITLKTAGHYLVTYSVGVDGAANRTSITTNLALNGTAVPQSYDYSYIRYLNSTTHGTATNMSIINASANDVLTLEWGATGAVGAYGTQTRSDRTFIAIVKLPDDGDYLITHDTSGTQDVGGLNNTILFDTSDEADSTSFSFSTSTGTATIQQDGTYLFMSGARSNRTSGTTRLLSAGRFYINGTVQPVGNTGMYVRGDQSTPDTFDGGWSAAGLFDLSTNDAVTFRQIDEGDNGNNDKFVANAIGLDAINLDTIFPYVPPNNAPNAPQTPYANDNSAQTGQATPVSGLVDPTPAFSAIFDDDDTSDQAKYYQIQVGTDTDWTSAEMWNSNKTLFSSPVDENTRSSDIIYDGSSLTAGSTYYWRIKFWDDQGGEGTWSANQQFSTASNDNPNAPQTPYCNNNTAQSGQASPVTNLTDSTPAFSAIFDDTNTSDTAVYYQIQVGTDTDWTSAEMWDSSKTSQSACSENTRCDDIIYSGTSLSEGNTYYWRIKFWDNRGGEGSWSTTQQFSMASNFDSTGNMGIYRDTSGTHDTNNTSYTGVPFNSQVTEDSAFTQNANDIDVLFNDSGHFLFGYVVVARNDTYGNRISYLSRVLLGGTEGLLGHGQGYRRNANNDRYYTYGYGVANADLNDNFRVEIIRSGTNSASHTLVANRSSLWILKLDDNWNYLKLQGQDNQSTSTSKQNINFTTSIENSDTNVYGHSTSTNPEQIVLKEAGYYLITYNIGIDGATNRTSATSDLSLNGTAIPQSFDYVYIRGTDGITEGATSNMTIIKANKDDVLRLEWGATGAYSAYSTQTISSKTGIAIVQLPNYADYLQIHENAGSQDIGGRNEIITFDTVDTQSTGSFSFSLSNSKTTVLKTDKYIFTSGARTNRTTGTARLTSAGIFYINDTISPLGNTGTYIRGDQGTADTFDGGWSGSGIFSLTANDTIDFRQLDEGDNGGDDIFIGNSYGLTGVNLSSLFSPRPNPPQTPYCNNTSAQNGQTSPATGISAPVFSAIFDDDDTGETSSYYQIQVGNDNDWTDTPEMWDSGKTSISSLSEDSRSSDISYGGSALSDGSTYYWRIRFWDSGGVAGAWSKIQEFKTNQLPTVTTVDVNSGNDIDLSEGSTKTVTWTATVTDPDGYSDIDTVTGKLFRSGVTGASSCTTNDENCYADTNCNLSNCSGSSCTATCSADIQFFADATDTGTYATEYWLGYIKATDQAGKNADNLSSSDITDVNSLLALSTDSSLSYGFMLAGDDSGSTNQTTTVTNTGNQSIDVDLSGDDMCTTYPTCSGDTIPANNQEYSTSTFTYGSGTQLSTTSSVVDISLPKSTQSPSNSSTTIYWGIKIPSVLGEGSYTGGNYIVATSDT